jgi:hypothetical protein
MNPSFDYEQAMRKAEGYSEWHFERIPDSKGLPSDAEWYLRERPDGDLTVKHITSRSRTTSSMSTRPQVFVLTGSSGTKTRARWFCMARGA